MSASDPGVQKVEHVINGTVESIYVDDELVFVADRDPKYKLNLLDYINHPALIPVPGTKPCLPIPCGDSNE